MLDIIFFISVLVIFIGVTLKGRDFFPFSHYPMFSSPQTIENVVVYRIGLERFNGEVVWWQSEFYRYPEFIGRKLKEIYQTTDSDKKSDIFILLEKRKYLAEVLRLMASSKEDIQNYQAFQIVERRVAKTKKKLEIIEKVVERVPIKSLRSGSNH